MEAGKFKVLGHPGKIKAVGELMNNKHKDHNGHEIAKQFFGFIGNVESNEGNENEEERTDGRANHETTRPGVRTCRGADESYRKNSIRAFQILHGSKRR